MFDRLEDLLIRYEELMSELSEPDVANNPERFRKLMKEQSDLQPIVDAYKEYKKNKENYEKSKILGRNIKNIRKQKKLTEMQLGKMIGKSRKFISLIEYPRYDKEIYLDSLFDISRALDVDIYYFFIGIE